MTTLRIFVLAFMLVSYSYQELVTEESAKKARKDCLKETGVKEELVDKAEKGDFPDDKDFKCFTKCFYAQLGYIDDSGEPEVEVIIENLPDSLRDKGKKAVEKCKKDMKGDACEKSFELHKCYFEEMQEDR